MIKFEHLERKKKGKQNMFSLVLQCFRTMGKGKKKVGWYKNVYPC